jgi:transcriptional regulator with XRE-family HTH domain
MQRGLSQDNIAVELGITQPAYARLEKKDDRISITRLIKIAMILKITISELIDEKSGVIIKDPNRGNPHTYVDKTIKADKEHILTLKDENFFLKKLLKKYLNE